MKDFLKKLIERKKQELKEKEERIKLSVQCLEVRENLYLAQTKFYSKTK